MSNVARRRFLTTLGGGLLPAILRAQARSKRYRSPSPTLGCPAWSWNTILEQGGPPRLRRDRLRGVAGEMDLPKVPSSRGAPRGDEEGLAALGLVVSRSRGLRTDAAAEGPRQAQGAVDEGTALSTSARRWASSTSGCSGDKIPEGEPRKRS